MTRQATPKEIRAWFKAEGYIVRIFRDGHINFRKPDDYVGRAVYWRDGGFLNNYRWSNGEVVL